MKPTVYIETTIIGYLAMRQTRDARTSVLQQVTRDWWDNERQRFELFISRFVVAECSAGDASAADERMVYLRDIPLAEASGEVERLTLDLIDGLQLPKKAEVDASHIATAAVASLQFLLTWNCTHIANAKLRPSIERICRTHGFEPPVICTPLELMEFGYGT